MKDLELFIVGLLLAQDAFLLMDKIGDRRLDSLLLSWHLDALEAGWRRNASA